MATVKEIAAKLVGSTSYSGEQPNGLSAAARVRERARENYGAGKSMSMFSRAHGEPVPNRKIWSMWDSQNFSFDSADTDTTGFKEQNRAAHTSAQERSQDNRDRVDSAIERNEAGYDEEYSAPNAQMPQSPESAELPEAEQRNTGKAGRNEAGARFTGVEEANREYAKRRGVQIARVS